MVKTRFAPSPTGPMHLGKVRTAPFSHCLARREKGVFLLRIEDTDAARDTEGSVAAIVVRPAFVEAIRANVLIDGPDLTDLIASVPRERLR